jgi:hypothetical protein
MERQIENKPNSKKKYKRVTKINRQTRKKKRNKNQVFFLFLVQFA